VKDIIAKAGSVAAVINTRHKAAKENGGVTSPPSVAVSRRLSSPT
jgi:hypothetical protein